MAGLQSGGASLEIYGVLFMQRAHICIQREMAERGLWGCTQREREGGRDGEEDERDKMS